MEENNLQTRHISPLMSQAFKPAAWLSNIDFIKRLISMHHLLIVIMSEAQGGKSTFVDLMRFKFEPAIRTILLPIEKEDPTLRLLTSLQTLFDVSFDAGPKAFEAFFLALPVSKHPVLLVIEHAQWIPFDCLQQLVLAYKQHAYEKKIHLCLVSDFSLSPNLHRLAHEEMKHFVHTIEPGPLTESEAKTYVMRYARGKKGLSNLLKPERFKAFYAITQGHIASIHEQLNVLDAPPSKNKNKLAKRFQALSAMGCVLALLIVMVLPHRSTLTPISSEHSSIQAKETTAIKLSQITPWMKGEDRLFFPDLPLDRVVEAVPQFKTALINIILKLTDKHSVLPSNIVVVHQLKSSVIPALHWVSEHTQYTHVEKKSLRHDLKKKRVAQHVAVENQKSAYTIQVLAAQSKAELHEFIKRYHVPVEQVHAKQIKTGKHWYVLTLGSYPRLAEAKQAAQRLPKHLKKNKPWIRTNDALKEVGWG